MESEKTVKLILDNLMDKREGIDLTNLPVYLDRLFRKDMARQKTTAPEQIIFDPELVENVSPMQNVLIEFLEEQLKEVENGLLNRGVKEPQGLPLEVLFTMVTEDGTKRNREVEAILEDLPRNRRLTRHQVEFCIEEFERIKILRRVNNET